MSNKTKIRDLRPHIELHRCRRTGIAWVQNGRTGDGSSCHLSIDATGSVRGMIEQGRWLKGDRAVRTCGSIYNIDSRVIIDAEDQIAADNCLCVACAELRMNAADAEPEATEYDKL